MARSRFNFRLQRLLEIRELREKQAHQELQARRAQKAEEQRQLQQLHEQEAKLVERMDVKPGESLDMQDRQFTDHARTLKQQEQKQQQVKVVQAGEKVEEQRETVKQRGIEVNALDKLKDKQAEEHHQEQLREEAVFLDDLATQGFLRRRTEAERREDAIGGDDQQGAGA